MARNSTPNATGNATGNATPPALDKNGEGAEDIADANKPKATKSETAALNARIDKLEAQVAALLSNPEKTSICPEFAQSLA